MDATYYPTKKIKEERKPEKLSEPKI